MRWEKNGKMPKTLHKTSQKEDWDQPQPWWFVAPTMSLSQWPTGEARVLKKKITQRIEHRIGSWESNKNSNKNWVLCLCGLIGAILNISFGRNPLLILSFWKSPFWPKTLILCLVLQNPVVVAFKSPHPIHHEKLLFLYLIVLDASLFLPLVQASIWLWSILSLGRKFKYSQCLPFVETPLQLVFIYTAYFHYVLSPDKPICYHSMPSYLLVTQSTAMSN